MIIGTKSTLDIVRVIPTGLLMDKQDPFTLRILLLNFNAT